MAQNLQSVFGNALEFVAVGSLASNDRAQDNERDEIDADNDPDLEEGEIADDDEPEKESKDSSDVSNLPKSSEDKANESKVVPSAHHNDGDRLESTGGLNKFGSGGSIEKRRDKRALPSNHTGSHKGRKRSDDEGFDHRDSNKKRRRTQDGDNDDMLAEEADFDGINVRGHSPVGRLQQRYGGMDSGGSDYDDNGVMTPRRHRGTNGGDARSRMGPGRASPPRRRAPRGSSRERGGGMDRRRSERERMDHRGDRRSMKGNGQSSNSSSRIKDEAICAFYMEGKCSRGSDCPYSHAALPPRKMELCKFYLLDCCAKKEKCLYLHKDFPCKFFHTGKKCRYSGEDCKFSHDSLSDTMRAILIKHIETAPREILGDFPRLTREETIQAIDHFSAQSNGREKRPLLPALFDTGADNHGHANSGVPLQAEGVTVDQPPNLSASEAGDSGSNRRVGFYQETAQSNSERVPPNRGDRSPEENSRSIWFGQLRQEAKTSADGSLNPLQQPDGIPTEKLGYGQTPSSPVGESRDHCGELVPVADYLSTLPARQRQLYRRIQQQQREPISTQEETGSPSQQNPGDDNWYSSDEEENKRSLSEVIKKVGPKPQVHHDKVTGEEAILPNLNLGSLDNINVAEIAKALSALQNSQAQLPTAGAQGEVSDAGARRDPRTRDPRMRSSQPVPGAIHAHSLTMGDVDLRVSAHAPNRHPGLQQDTDLRLGHRTVGDVDLRSSLGNVDDMNTCSSDVDLRRLGLPFKSAAPLHHLVQEIEASYDSHPPVDYRVVVVDRAPLDYSLIRVQSDWAHLDPRQQRRFFSAEDSIRQYTNADPPSIPLGPASPDPESSTSLRPYETADPYVYSAMRTAPADPRARDPRRAAPASASSVHHPAALQMSEKRGLLGAAPPGMAPFVSNSSIPSHYDAPGSYDSYRPTGLPRSNERGQGDAGGGGEPARLAENRRDPRQRFRNPL